MSDFEALSLKQQQAIAALLSGLSQLEVAKKVKISSRQLSRWLNEEDFVKALAEARGSLYQETLNRLVDASVDAIILLRSVINDSSVASGVRVRAAETVLRLGFEQITTSNLQQRLSELEAKLDGAKQ